MMKATALGAVLVVCNAVAFAQQGDMKGMDMKEGMSKKSETKTHHASGVVKSVSPQKGTISIAHGAVPTMNWSAMTMTFKAKDKKMLEAFKPGAKVDFDFQVRGKDHVITNIAPG